jgi:hypothetical protein
MKPVPSRNDTVVAAADSAATTVVVAAVAVVVAVVAAVVAGEESLVGNSCSTLNGLCSDPIHSALTAVPTIPGLHWSSHDFL